MMEFSNGGPASFRNPTQSPIFKGHVFHAYLLGGKGLGSCRNVAGLAVACHGDQREAQEAQGMTDIDRQEGAMLI